MKLSKLIRELSVVRDEIKIDPEVIMSTRLESDYKNSLTLNVDEVLISGIKPIVILVGYNLYKS